MNRRLPRRPENPVLFGGNNWIIFSKIILVYRMRPNHSVLIYLEETLRLGSP